MEKSADNAPTGLPRDLLIVIGRQFGSGGRTIGKLIASRMGLEYYDTELLKKAAQSEGVSEQIFEQHDEKKPSVLKALLQGAYGIADNFHTVPISSERIYNVQSRVIKDLCRKGPCVIVGRNADFIMRNNPHLLSIFLHAPLEKRVEKILERKEAMSKEEAEELARHHDRRREAFYNFYRGEKLWGVASNYHLSIDTSAFDNETVAQMIIEVAKNKFNSQGKI